MAGVLASTAATVSPRLMPRFCSAEPSCRAGVELPIVPGALAVNDRGLGRIDLSGAGEQRQRRQRLEIRRIAVEIGVIGRRHGALPEVAASWAGLFLKPSEPGRF